MLQDSEERKMVKSLRTKIVNRYELPDHTILNISESQHNDVYFVIIENAYQQFEFGTMSGVDILDKWDIQLKQVEQ